MVFSCKNTPTDTAPTSQPANATQQPATNGGFEAIPADLVMKMWNEGDLIDYIFHNLPFSMNQTEQASIRTNLTYFSQEAQPNIPSTCKSPFGRQFYGVGGDIIFEADIYLDENCAFYVFFIDGKPKYANKMSEQGRAFFGTMIQKGLEARKQATGQ